jgi:FixJ family two-component response regulator
LCARWETWPVGNHGFSLFEPATVQHLAGTPAVRDAPRERVPTSESLVVLTRDAALAQTVKALGSEHVVATVRAEADLAGELISKHIGVAIIDVGATSSPVDQLTERLKSQFPDLILIVAGRLDDQSTLAQQISAGTVYRFLHKPVSEQRVRLFVDAAWRRHDEESGTHKVLTTTGIPAALRSRLTYNSLWLGAGALAVLAIAASWLMTRQTASAVPPHTARSQLPLQARDEPLEALLLRGDQAFAAGALLAPPGQNAADLYQQALHHNHSDPRAAAGIERVIDKLLSAAETELARQHFKEAQKLTDQARAISGDHARVAFVTAQISKARERFLLRAREVAAAKAAEQETTVVPDDK